MSTKANTTIDTLKRFWKQNWHRILSAFSVLLVVCSIAFSCGVNSKAYETSPPSFVPFTVTSVDPYGGTISTSVDPNGTWINAVMDDAYQYSVLGTVVNAYSSTVGNSDAATFPIEIDLGDPIFGQEDLTLTINCLDVYPFIESGYCPNIHNGPDAMIYGGPHLSPFKHIYLSYYVDDVDFTPRELPCTVSYSYVEGNANFISTGTLNTTVRLNEEALLFSPLERHFNIYDELDLSVIPSSSWITGIQFDLASFVRDYIEYSPDSSFMTINVVQIERAPSAAKTAQRFLANVLSPSLVVPDTNGSYQEGYLDGLNKGQTESLGVVDWLLKAGDSVMDFQLFRVVNTPVTIGSIFTVLIGSLLIIFILKVFAGG